MHIPTHRVRMVCPAPPKVYFKVTHIPGFSPPAPPHLKITAQNDCVPLTGWQMCESSMFDVHENALRMLQVCSSVNVTCKIVTVRKYKHAKKKTAKWGIMA